MRKTVWAVCLGAALAAGGAPAWSATRGDEVAAAMIGAIAGAMLSQDDNGPYYYYGGAPYYYYEAPAPYYAPPAYYGGPAYGRRYYRDHQERRAFRGHREGAHRGGEHRGGEHRGGHR